MGPALSLHFTVPQNLHVESHTFLTEGELSAASMAPYYSEMLPDQNQLEGSRQGVENEWLCFQGPGVANKIPTPWRVPRKSCTAWNYYCSVQALMMQKDVDSTSPSLGAGRALLGK